jgi:hypothetical protein
MRLACWVLTPIRRRRVRWSNMAASIGRCIHMAWKQLLTAGTGNRSSSFATLCDRDSLSHLGIRISDMKWSRVSAVRPINLLTLTDSHWKLTLDLMYSSQSMTALTSCLSSLMMNCTISSASPPTRRRQLHCSSMVRFTDQRGYVDLASSVVCSCDPMSVTRQIRRIGIVSCRFTVQFAINSIKMLLRSVSVRLT